MIKPQYWFNYWRTRQAIVGYPLYDVPNKQAEGRLPKDKIDENFAYFMSVRLERLAFFQSWLARWFRVKAPLTGDGVLAIEAWANGHCGALIAGVERLESAQTFISYQPPWQGDRAGYNVLVDMAIFMGEFLIARRPHLYWTPLPDENGGFVADRDGGPVGSTLGRPELGGYCFPLWHSHFFQSAFARFQASRGQMVFGGTRLVRIRMNWPPYCRMHLHMASHRDPETPFISEDYENGPL